MVYAVAPPTNGGARTTGKLAHNGKSLPTRRRKEGKWVLCAKGDPQSLKCTVKSVETTDWKGRAAGGGRGSASRSARRRCHCREKEVKRGVECVRETANVQWEEGRGRVSGKPPQSAYQRTVGSDVGDGGSHPPSPHGGRPQRLMAREREREREAKERTTELPTATAAERK